MNKSTSELMKAQSQVSQVISNKSEISTIDSQKPVDSNTKSIVENKQLVSDSVSKKSNSKENTNSFAPSEDSNSDANSSNNSNKSSATDKVSSANFVNSGKSILQNQSNQKVVLQQLNDSVKNFIENTPNIYFIRAQELLECEESVSYSLAVETIQNVKTNEDAGWVLTGIAAYRVWSNTTALSGGYGKTAALGEGRMNVLKDLAEDCSQHGPEVKLKTLYDFVRRIKVLLEEPMKAFEGMGEETIRRERTVLMEKLFAVPSTFARAAVSTTKPLEALEIACQKRAIERNNSFTLSAYENAIRHLKKGANDTKIDDAGQKGGSDHGEIPEASDSGNDGNNTAAVSLRIAVPKTEKPPFFEQMFSGQISSEARRVNLKPEQVKGLYVSFLQTMLSTFQDMGVEK